MSSIKVKTTQPVRERFGKGSVLCLDIDGTPEPTGKNACFDVDMPPRGFRSFYVDDFPLNVHKALPAWFDELGFAYTHCA